MKELFFYSLIVLTLIVYTAHADKTTDLQAYPSSEYLVGVSEGPGTVETLMDRAEAQLSKKIFDKVRHIINKNEGDWLAYNRVREHYGTVMQSSERSKLKGIREYYPPQHRTLILLSTLSVMNLSEFTLMKLRIYAKKSTISFIRHKL